MDKFLSGFGLGGMLGASKPKAATRNPLNDISEIPVPKQQDTQLPNRPAQVVVTEQYCNAAYGDKPSCPHTFIYSGPSILGPPIG